ncbi:MAG: proline iminopeptidase-family hydrolase [Saprospiraceae bacterium]|nr:proline iminopeptidase-family hydrolase [Saprospiraceae bacterium]
MRNLSVLWPSLLLATLFFLGSCNQQPTQTDNTALSAYLKSPETGVKTGGTKVIEINTPKGKFKVWTKRVGNNPRMKVLLLHGGPACTHEYFECFESFLPEEGIEFYYYDQLGSFYSDQPKDTSLWNTERFVEEVEQVRQALGLNKDNFYLLGHSWGGILAMEYALKYQQNLKGLIISNMMMSIPDYNQYANEVLAKQMPQYVVDSVRLLESKGMYTDPAYMRLLIPHHYAKHICRLPVDQWPDPMQRGLNHVNPEIYVLMQGPSEFGASGRLEFWDVKSRLSTIKVPTLSIGGNHDTMDPAHMAWIATQVGKGRSLICPEGSHMSMWDDQAHYFPGLIQFIKDVDGGRF